MPRKTKKQLKEELLEIIEESEFILNSITNDNSVPRNIRRVTQEATDELKKDEDSLAVNASNAISLLDDLSQDPNCPSHTRTRIYQLLSLLEQIRDL
ncbi:MAG: UPF0147 family protein [archaeon]|nr:UPF0147 family protein [archaeon]